MHGRQHWPYKPTSFWSSHYYRIIGSVEVVKEEEEKEEEMNWAVAGKARIDSYTQRYTWFLWSDIGMFHMWPGAIDKGSITEGEYSLLTRFDGHSFASQDGMMFSVQVTGPLVRFWVQFPDQGGMLYSCAIRWLVSHSWLKYTRLIGDICWSVKQW